MPPDPVGKAPPSVMPTVVKCAVCGPRGGVLAVVNEAVALRAENERLRSAVAQLQSAVTQAMLLLQGEQRGRVDECHASHPAAFIPPEDARETLPPTTQAPLPPPPPPRAPPPSVHAPHTQTVAFAPVGREKKPKRAKATSQANPGVE